MKWKSGAKFGVKDKMLGVLTLSFTHTQALIGIILYILQSRWTGFAHMGEKYFRFFAVEHLIGMMLAVILITIGYSKAKKATKDSAKFRKTFVWFLAAVLVIFISIPWPFMGHPWSGYF